MGEAASPEKPLSVESEFAHLVSYIDLYIRQKTDLFIQHYVFDPFDFLVRQIVYLSVLAALLVAGTLALLIGVILFISHAGTHVGVARYHGRRSLRHRGPGGLCTVLA